MTRDADYARILDAVSHLLVDYHRTIGHCYSNLISHKHSSDHK